MPYFSFCISQGWGGGGGGGTKQSPGILVVFLNCHFPLTCITVCDGACENTSYMYYPGQKKKNHPRDSRREERCSSCDFMLDHVRSAQGKSRGQSRIGLALR